MLISEQLALVCGLGDTTQNQTCMCVHCAISYETHSQSYHTLAGDISEYKNAVQAIIFLFQFLITKFEINKLLSKMKWNKIE